MPRTSTSPSGRRRPALRRAGAATGTRSRAAACGSRRARGTYTAGQLVICPGAWAPQLLADLGIPFTVERQVHVLVPARSAGSTPFLPSGIRSTSTRTPHGSQIYGFPAIDGPDGGAKVAFFRAAASARRRPSTATVHDDEIARDGGTAARRPARPARPVPAAATVHVLQHARTSTSSSPGIPTHEASPSRAASPGTASSSSRWSARSWPTSPSTAAPAIPSRCSTRSVW